MLLLLGLSHHGTLLSLSHFGSVRRSDGDFVL
jgi:hypothetical protein